MSRRRLWPCLAHLMPHFSRVPVLLRRSERTSSPTFIDAASITDVAEKFLARASLRLLYSKCRHAAAEGLPSLESPPAVTPLESAGATGSGSGSGVPTPPLSSTWQESWPAKLSPEKTLSLRKHFEEDYPTELLDSGCFPSARLLALSHKMLAEKGAQVVAVEIPLKLQEPRGYPLGAAPHASPLFRIERALA